MWIRNTRLNRKLVHNKKGFKKSVNSPAQGKNKKNDSLAVNVDMDLAEENDNVDLETMGIEEENVDHDLKFNVSDEDFHWDSQVVKEPTPTFHIHSFGSVDVLFPYENPYPCQMTIMEEIIKRVENKEHSIIESPTGTGKTAALLCSLLAWQQQKHDEMKKYFEKQKERRDKNKNHSPPNKKSKVGPNNNSDNQSSNEIKPIPTIYYTTRTHTQIAQVISQLKKSPYNNIPMVVLASREKACINKEARIPQKSNSEVSTGTGENTKTPAERFNDFCSKKREEAETQNRNKYSSDSNEQEKKSPPLKSLCSFYHHEDQADFTSLLLEKGQVVDVEDLVKYGKDHLKCPYYGMKEMQKEARIVFCTYNHVLDPNVRRSSKVKIPNNIFVFDEAHNIENICQDVGRFEIDKGKLEKATEWLIKAEEDKNLDDQVKRRALVNLKGALKRLSNWFHNHKDDDPGFKEIPIYPNDNNNDDKNSNGKSNKKKFMKDLTNTKYEDFLTSPQQQQQQQNQSPNKPEIVEIFRRLGLGPDKLKGLWCSYFILLDRHNVDLCRHPACYRGKDKIKNPPEPAPAPGPSTLKDDGENSTKNKIEVNLQSGFKVDQKSINIIKEFLWCLEFFYKTDAENPNPKNEFYHFRDYKIYLEKEEDVNPTPKSKINFTLQFICLNPGIVFKTMKTARTVIVASGTLSPLDSFSSELDFDFKKAPTVSHVVPASNVFSAVITKNMEKTKELNFSWNSMMRENQVERNQVNIYQDLGEIFLKICRLVPHGILIFVPSKTFLITVKGHFVKLGILEKLNGVKNGGLFFEHEMEWGENSCNQIQEFVQGAKSEGGAILFAIIRGRVSEGVDFTNNEARAVITVGIPNLPFTSAAIRAKREYNNDRRRATGKTEYLNGWDWYNLSAFRALNQAFGRCIRHQADWGGIFIIDHRFLANEKVQKLSDWVKRGIQIKESMDMTIPGLEKFVERNKNQ